MSVCTQQIVDRKEFTIFLKSHDTWLIVRFLLIFEQNRSLTVSFCLRMLPFYIYVDTINYSWAVLNLFQFVLIKAYRKKSGNSSRLNQDCVHVGTFLPIIKFNILFEGNQAYIRLAITMLACYPIGHTW